MSLHVVRDPDPETALTFLREELQGLAQRRGHLVQVVAECSVQYQGRARSMLHRGERLLLLKPDGTFLVHTAKKAKPVNWQPPGATFHAAIEDGVLVLTAYRPKPEELVRVVFGTVHALLSIPLHDGAELSLVGSEDDLQRLLFERPDVVEPGFRPRRRERSSERGFYDLDGDDADGQRLVVEVKRTTAGVKEAQQLWRYVEPLRAQNKGVRGMLVAPRVTGKAQALLRDHDLEWKEVHWERLLPKIEAIRHGGQVGLERFSR